jgi:hypothetical protein
MMSFETILEINLLRLRLCSGKLTFPASGFLVPLLPSSSSHPLVVQHVTFVHMFFFCSIDGYIRLSEDAYLNLSSLMR